MVVIEFNENHDMPAVRTGAGIIAKGRKYRSAPFVEGKKDTVFFTGNGPVELFVRFSVAGIQTVVPDHLEMFFRDMLDDTANEIENRNGFFHIYIILMAIVVEGDEFTIIFVNARSSDNRASQIPAYVFDDIIGITLLGFGIDIETILMVSIRGSLIFSESITDVLMHQGKQSRLPCIAKIFVIEMRLGSPSAGITETAFRDETMDMRIPFKITTEGVKNTDEAGSEAFSFVIFVEHPGDNRIDGSKEVIKE